MFADMVDLSSCSFCNCRGLFNQAAFRRNLVTDEPGSAYAGAYGYNLGGRSIFWGAFAPRMRAWEFNEEGSSWPGAARDDLLRPNGYLDRAEALLKVGTPRPSTYQDVAKAHVAAVLGPDYEVLDAPMAVQRQTTELRTLSAGVFSTADLLMESAATRGPTGSDNLAINLHQDVTRVEVPQEGTGDPHTVYATDRLGFVDRTYRARAVVLAAGTLESPKIGALSGLPNASGTLGYGLTDHPVWFTHFGVSPGGALYSDDASAKVLIRPADASAVGDRWNAILELGADYNQGRYIDADILAAHQRERDEGKPTQLCELVFLASAPLDEGGFVRPADTDDGRPMRVRAVPAMRNVEALLTSAGAVQGRLLESLGATPLPSEPADLPLLRAGIGGVAHEVGTMRMAAAAADGVVSSDLRVHGTEGVYVCDLSVFPSSPAANPTLALAALAARLGDHLADRLVGKAG